MENSREEQYLLQIISSCERILQSLEEGQPMNDGDFNCLGYADGMLFNISKNMETKID